MSTPRLQRKDLLFAQLVCLVLTASIFAAIWFAAGGHAFSLAGKIVYWVAAVLLTGGSCLGLFSWRLQRDRIDRLEQQLERNRNRTSLLEHQLEGVIRLNQLLIDAQHERELVENALTIIADFAGAAGSSYMPFDEWGQPVMVYTQGVLPASVIKGWAEHLGAPAVRGRCRECRQLEAASGESCPLLEPPFNESIRIYCLPLQRGGRVVGMVNLYLSSEVVLSDEQRSFMDLLLREMLLAIDMIRLRGQELATLHQLHTAHEQSESLTTILARLMEGLCDVLDYRGARLEFKPAEPHFSGLRLFWGQEEWLRTKAADALVQGQFSQSHNHDEKISQVMQDESAGQVIAARCGLPEGGVIGVLVLAGAPEWPLQKRHIDLVETVAGQAALLVENERQRLAREYRTVIQERARLAREIHDSLAQTLAYLKLTAAQMQSQLASGDMVRLEQSLNQSYQALSEAYLDTRTVIDNLRIEPQQDVVAWLKQITGDFQKSTDLKVAYNLPEAAPRIKPEIQAQLMRIVQEGLSNVRKHAHAQQVWVSLRIWDGELILELTDDGKGFSAEDVPELSRYGLRGMRERAELIGADFQIISKPGDGTTIRLQMPYKREESRV